MTHTNNTHTMTITELRQKRKGIIEQMREARKKAIAAMKEGKSTDEYDAEFDRAEADERALSKQIEQEERLDKIQRDEAAKFLDTAGASTSHLPKPTTTGRRSKRGSCAEKMPFRRKSARCSTKSVAPAIRSWAPPLWAATPCRLASCPNSFAQ